MRCYITILISVLLFGSIVHGQVLKVKDNTMYITLPKALSESSLERFIEKYSLQKDGLTQLVRSGRTDSLSMQGWKVKTYDKLYVLTKPLDNAEPDPYPAGKIIFNPVPTPETWREIGGNRTTWGFNRFKNGREFRRDGDIVYVHLWGYSGARQVKLAGNFTNWQHDAFPMNSNDSGWTVKVKLEPGQYYYKFIIDGNWITDRENLISENDGRGNINSVFFVPNRTFKLNGYKNAWHVYLAASFNNWSPESIPLNKTAEGWMIELFVEGGTYKYHYLADGKKVQPEKEDDFGVVIGNVHTFRLNGFHGAKKVVLAGNFNDWNKEELMMTKTNDGWERPYVLGPGNYQYKFIVDGRWMTDPGNSVRLKDANGNENSFLVIGENHTFRLKDFDNAKVVTVTGDFTGYSPTGIPMWKTKNGWEARVYLAKGKHRYRFFVDGKPIHDPANKAWEFGEKKESLSVIWIDPNEPL